jgi:hypothetical protein
VSLRYEYRRLKSHFGTSSIMSSSYSTYIGSVVHSLVLYMGMSTTVVGVLGNILNILVFLSLKIFRESSCAFYLNLMSFVNIGQLITGQLSRVMITGFYLDWTKTSLFYCKFRPFGLQAFTFISLTCLCLATLDQFFATCARVYWHRWNNIQFAHRFGAMTVVFWILYCIPYLIFYDQTVSPSTDAIDCGYSNMNFRQYHAYMNSLILSGGLPLVITVTFGSLAYRNVRQIAYRTIPLVRRELDKQLTNMVLIQIIVSFFVLLPYFAGGVIPLVTNDNNSLSKTPQFSLAINICACIYYLHFAVSIYLLHRLSDMF